MHVERRSTSTWVLLAVVMAIAIPLQTYGMKTWPMADDEVPSLVELGILHIGAEQYFSVPAAQIERLPKATPVWNRFQRTAIAMLPASEVSYRIPSVVCGLVTTALVLLVGLRRGGVWWAGALIVLLMGSQTFIYLQQLNRFYSLPLLLLLTTLFLMWQPNGGITRLALVVVMTALTVLSHNITVPVFGLAFGAAAVLFVVGRTPWTLVLRSGAAAMVAGGTYLFYLRPLIQGWNSTGNPTPVLVSFAAHLGTPVLALACLGAWLAVSRRDAPAVVLWSGLVLAGSLVLFTVTAGWMSWNPRYFLFYMPAAWMLAAFAMTAIAERLGHGLTGAAWYAAVVVMLAPSIASHLADGSRHDYRRAAEILTSAGAAGSPILSDDAETISYYLSPALRERLEVRTRVVTPPVEPFFTVVRSNAWMPQPLFPGRRVDLIAEVSRRRLDQFSHVLRVYRVDGLH